MLCLAYTSTLLFPYSRRKYFDCSQNACTFTIFNTTLVFYLKIKTNLKLLHHKCTNDFQNWWFAKFPTRSQLSKIHSNFNGNISVLTDKEQPQSKTQEPLKRGEVLYYTMQKSSMLHSLLHPNKEATSIIPDVLISTDSFTNSTGHKLSTPWST